MLAVFGANGMTGIEVVREALRNNIPVRPIVRDDHDTHRLDQLQGSLSVNDICYANADHPSSIKVALEGATAVLSCLDARTSGWGSPVYTPEAAANIVKVAAEMGIERILHMSVMGAYRWSHNPLNRQSFHLDRWVRRSQVHWTMLRISCYHDEMIDAHIQPPDNGRPHPILPSARYSPVSRADAARTILNIMPTLVPNRTWLLGGPKVYSGLELQELARQYGTTTGKNLTERGPLPHGDMSVPPETTEIMVGLVPTESLEWMLDPDQHPLNSSKPGDDLPFWERPDPQLHWCDQGEEATAPRVETGQSTKGHVKLTAMSSGLRYALHEALSRDALIRLELDGGLLEREFRLDFSAAEWLHCPPFSRPPERPHKSPMRPISKVRITTITATQLHSGNIDFIYDDLADVFFAWWSSNSVEQITGRPNSETPLLIPEDIWDQLDLGVRRRLERHPRWKFDPKVRAFAAQRHEKTSFVPGHKAHVIR